jgi:hypothetical protein
MNLQQNQVVFLRKELYLSVLINQKKSQKKIIQQEVYRILKLLR